jgi:hypothetical protein
MEAERQKDYFDAEVQRRAAMCLKLDLSFKCIQHMMQLDGTRLYEALLTALNEYNEIRMQHFTHSTSHTYMELPLKSMLETCKLLGITPPQFVYVDDCCQSRKFYESQMPNLTTHLRNAQILPLPEKHAFFECSNRTVMSQIDAYLLHVLDYLKAGNSIVVAYDSEWDAYPKPDKNNKRDCNIKVVQLALKVNDEGNSQQLILKDSLV